jgi:hypothetical protein
MTTLDEMADRSDRREDKPITCLGVRTRPIDWLLTRGFLFGQEIPGSTGAQFLHSQAGDTTAVLTLRLNGCYLARSFVIRDGLLPEYFRGERCGKAADSEMGKWSWRVREVIVRAAGALLDGAEVNR